MRSGEAPKKTVRRLYPGDTVEFSISQQLPYPKGAESWVKAGGSTTIREGETTTQAKRRLSDVIHDWLDDEVAALMDS